MYMNVIRLSFYLEKNMIFSAQTLDLLLGG